MTAILGSAAFVVGLVVGWPAPYALACVALIAVVMRGERWVVFAVVVACAAAGDLRGSAALDVDRATTENVSPFDGEITSYARRTPTRQNVELRTTSGLHLCVQTDHRLSLGRGDRVRVEGQVVEVTRYPPSREAALRSLGCVGTVDATSIRVLEQGHGWWRWLENKRREITEWFSDAAPGDSGALLAGLTVGDDDGLSFETREGFYDLGMSHITAVSGSNLALLTWLLLARGTRRRITLDVAALVLLWLYVFLAGAGPSTIRAGLTATVCVLVVWTGRRPDLLSIACLVAATQVAVDPGLIGNLAYRLSTVAMMVMIATLAGRGETGWRSKVTALVSCSVAIQLGTLPFVPDPDQAIVAGVMANCLAAPLVGLAFGLGMVAAVLRPISESAAAAVVVVAELPTRLILDLVETMDGSALARLRPGSLGWAPLLVVRATLLGLVTVVFGRHARRGSEMSSATCGDWASRSGRSGGASPPGPCWRWWGSCSRVDRVLGRRYCS